MATLTAGQSATIGLDAWATLTLVVSGSATIAFTSQAPQVHPSFNVTNATSRSYGPFGCPMSAVVRAVDRGVTYTIEGGVGGYSRDSAGNVTGLVGPDDQKAFDFQASLRSRSLLRHGKPWLRQPTATTGLTAIGSVTLAATTRHGRNCIEITSPATTSVQGFYFALPSAQTVTARQHVVFEVEDASEWNGGNWRLGFFDGSAGVFTGNGKQQVMTVGTQNGWDGVHVLAPLATEWATVGSGAFDSTVMTQCAFRFVRKSSPTGTSRIWVYEIAENEGNALPSIVVGADDGAATWYSSGLPLCEKYGFSSYLAFIADDRGTATRMSQAQWADAVDRGHHAVVHGCKSGVASLRDYFSSYTGYASPQAAMQADIAHNRDTMVSEGLDPDGRGRHVYVLPQGYHQPSGGAGDDTIHDAMVAEGMTCARRAVSEGALMVNGGWAGAAHYIPIIGHNWSASDETANVAAVIAQMEAEIAAGRSVVLMFHEVQASPDAAEEITSANLESILSAAATLVRAGTARAGKLTDLAEELAAYSSPVHVGQ